VYKVSHLILPAAAAAGIFSVGHQVDWTRHSHGKNTMFAVKTYSYRAVPAGQYWQWVVYPISDPIMKPENNCWIA